MPKKSNLAEMPKEVTLKARVSFQFPDGSLKVIVATKDGERAFVVDGANLVPESVPGSIDDEPTPQEYPQDPNV